MQLSAILDTRKALNPFKFKYFKRYTAQDCNEESISTLTRAPVCDLVGKMFVQHFLMHNRNA